MKIHDFISNLRNEHDIHIVLNGEELKLRGTKENLTKEIITQVKERKAEIVTYYKSILAKKGISKIPKAENKEYYPLSNVQRTIYFRYEFDSDSTAFNMPKLIKCIGKLDKDILTKAFDKLIERHESLRTNFIVVDGHPFQKIQPPFSLKIDTIRVLEDEVKQSMSDFMKPFKLDTDALIRIALLEVSNEKNYLLIDTHHIVNDGVSDGLIIKDLIAFYHGIAVPELKIQFKDYTEWENSKEQQERIQKNEDYWVSVFKDKETVLQLPYDHDRPNFVSDSGGVCLLELDKELSKQLQELAQRNNVTMFMLFLAAYNILLSKLSNQQDIVVGVTTAGRSHSDLDEVVGMFVRSIPILNEVVDSQTFEEFLHTVKQSTVKSFDHQNSDLDAIAERLNRKRIPGRNRWFDTMLVFHNYEQPSIDISGLQIEPVIIDFSSAKFDLTLNVENAEDHFVLFFEYAKDLFEESSIVLFGSYLKNVLTTIATNESISIGAIELLSEDKKNTIHDFNPLPITRPSQTTIIDLFHKQVEENADSTAVIFEKEDVSYFELNERANRLSNYLLNNYSIGKDDIIGIYASRGVEMIICLLAVLKAGASYTPIDIELNQTRIKAIVSDSDLNFILTNLSNSLKDIVSKNKIVDIDNLSEALLVADTTNPQISISQDSLAYCMFTSGSTGRPKGILIEHLALLDFCLTTRDMFSISTRDRMIQQASLSFDTSIEEIFPVLISGASLLIMRDKGRDIFAIIDAVKNKGANILNTSPVVLNELNKYAKEISSLRFIIIGGDALHPSQIDQIIHYCDIYQTYGPSEVTIGITCGKLYKPEDAANIGKPISNRSVYILNETNTLCPINVPGELCVAGIGLARGYLNNDQLTQEKFVVNPLHPDERIYRTGDLVKWLPSGDLQFLGRIDNQIKIGGIRIEPGEIELHLLEHSQINEVAVLLYGPVNNKSLVAYYVSSEAIEIGEIQSFLRDRLPHYMIPTYFVYMSSFPRNISGKINKGELPEPKINLETAFVGSSTKEEKLLATVWEKVLKIERIGVTDNFFSLGGDSIKSMQIVTNLRMEGYSLSIKEIFKFQNIKELAQNLELLNDPDDQEINEDKTKKNSVLIQGDKLDAYLRGSSISSQLNIDVLQQLHKKENIELLYPLSPMQQGMLFHSLLIEDSGDYFSHITFQVEGDLNIDLLQQSYSEIIKRHEILRANFFQKGFEKPFQIITKNKKPDFTFIDVRALLINSSTEEYLDSFLKKDQLRGFHLTNDNLMRLTVIQTKETTYQLVWSYHHIIIDGWCMARIISEFQTCYKNYASGILPQLPSVVSYSKFIEWLGFFNKEEASHYWSNYLENYNNLSEIPQLAKSTEKVVSPNYVEKAFKISEKITQQLQDISIRSGVTLNTILQTSWGILLSKYNNTYDVAFGTVVSGRPSEIDRVEEIVGVFINTIPVRIQFNETTTIDELLKQTQLQALDGLDYLHYPLSDIQNTSELKSGLFNHIMAFQNLPVEENNALESPFKISNVTSLNRTSYDLWIIITPSTQLDIAINYNANVYDSQTIDRIETHLLHILASIIAKIDVPISGINLLSPLESNQILYDFNDTAKPYSSKKLMHQLFEEQVVKSPGNVAVISNGNSYSYQWLNEASNQFAHYLRAIGIEREDAVAVIMDRDISLLVTLLAILKAGGKYIPIEPYIPDNRKLVLINTVATKFVVTNGTNHKELVKRLESIKTLKKLISYDSINRSMVCKEIGGEGIKEINIGSYPMHNPKIIGDSMDLAYIIFTSGSTGNPKGVAVQHAPVINLIEWVNNTYDVNTLDTILMVSSVSFDLSVYDLFGGFAVGASIRIANEEELASPATLANIIIEEHITFWDSAPAMLQQVLPFLEQRREEVKEKGVLRISFSSGDWIPLALPDRMKALFDNYKFIGLGGATEATIWSNYFEVHEVKEYWKSIPYGKPIQNAKYLIVDDALNLCPIGVKGNLVIGGQCLAQSYFNEKELSAQRFIDSPFYEDEKLYYTGDMARWFEDGNIEFLGRKDSQVKIRGYRIELGEIEKTILQHPEINHVVTLVRERSKYDKYICAYYLCERELTKKELDVFLGEYLPSYMLPSYYVRLEEIPITNNGKINRKELPDPSYLDKNRKLKKPSTVTETKLIQTVGDLLHIDFDVISMEDDFFELGGHSILAVHLMGQIEKQFNCIISLREIFENGVLHQLVTIINSKSQNKTSAITSIGEQKSYVLSSAQERMYYHYLYNKDNLLYNISLAYVLKGDVDYTKIESCIKQLVAHHGALRTSFELTDSGVRQKIESTVETPFEIGKIDSDTSIEDEFKIFRKSFDLSKAPLIKFKIMEAPFKKILFVDVHHIICDGISLNNLMNDFQKLYSNKSLDDSLIRYVDYASWQKDLNGSINNMKTYWSNKLTPPLSVIELPTTELNQDLQRNEAAIANLTILEEDYKKLKIVTSKERVSEYMYLISAFYLLLYKISGSDDLIIETDAVGRTSIQLERVVGTFINIVPLRIIINPETSYNDFLKQVKETVLEAMENQDFQYNDLLHLLNEKEIATERTMGRVHFAYANYYQNESKNDTIQFEALSLDRDHSSGYELKIEAQANNGELKLYFIYNLHLFEEETITLLMKYYREILTAIIQDTSIPIGEMIFNTVD
ncbi:non-ribosomal peptide synthetase [Aquimarina intermedia]|uniref:Amino acid adenylation domain-containing protein n=1 Tax=Aquimarina intermedia TaxID=350814 RepID=A0A5S5C4W9_9FLAO|nr:non-ribosomal peptide synthetase [Aquimarina intermedia]TYP74357.1 amino acid adenylation domain-containing protein [Aquimarina intermedia]